MKKSNLSVLLACAAFFGVKTAHAKITKATLNDLKISKVYYAGSKSVETNKAYRSDQYLEIINNTYNYVDVQGLYIGLTETESDNSVGYPASVLNDSVVLKQLFRIPYGTEVPLAPGKTLLITNSAIDHSSIATNGHDLSDADYEVKSTNTNYSQHNDNVPALELIYTFTSATDFMNFTNSGPCGIVLFPYDLKVDTVNKIYGQGKTYGNLYIKEPSWKIIDGVDILRNSQTSGVDTASKRLLNSVDSGYTAVTSSSTWGGETVYRKNALYSSSRVILYDTDNSTVDFASSTTIQPRQFLEEEYGVSDTTVTIPETGYLPIKPSKPFFGSSDVYIVNVNASSASDRTDLTYYNYRADTVIAMATSYVLVGQPGEHQLKFSDGPASLKGSTIVYWSDTAGVISNTKKRYMYKFVNTTDSVGFKRDENFADTAYVSIYLAEGEHLYILLPSKAVGYIETNNNLESGSLTWIEWHGITPNDVTTPVRTVETTRGVYQTREAVYNLNGQRVDNSYHGIVIKNGRKIIQ